MLRLRLASVVVMTAVLALASMGGIAAAQSSSGDVSITASTPSSVPQDGTFSVSYTVENNASDGASYKIAVPNLPKNTTVSGFTGKVRAPSPDSNPPSASTEFIPSGESATLTVEYETTGITTDTLSVEATAEAPLSEATDKAISTVSVEQPGPDVTVTSAPSLITQGNGMSIEYNIAADGVATTLKITKPQTGVNVSDFSGAIRSSNPTGSPPTATTEFIATNSSESVTVDYTVSKNVFDTNQNVTQSITLVASNPTAGTSGTATTNVTIQKQSAVPSDPALRATKIADANSTADIGQGDVSLTVTKFNRDSTADNIDVTQEDVSLMITFFQRNK